MSGFRSRAGRFTNVEPQDLFLKLRPRLRSGVLLLPGKDGLYVKREYLGVQYAIVHTKDAEELIYVLSKYLTGDWTAVEICEMFQGKAAEEIAGLLKFLFKNGYVTHVEDDARDEVMGIVGTKFEDQIKFLSHCSTRPWAAFQEFRNTRILLVGGGISLKTCAVELLRTGLERLSVLPITVGQADDDLQEVNEVARAIRDQGVNAQVSIVNVEQRNSLEEYDLIACCADMPYLRNLITFERKAVLSGRPFYPGIAVGGCAFVGPLIEPGSSICWACNVLNRARDYVEDGLITAFQRDHVQLNLPLGAEFTPSTKFAKMIGAEIAFELFKALAGVIRPEIQNYLQIYTTKSNGAVRLNSSVAPPDACLGTCEVLGKRAINEYHMSATVVRPG